MKLENNQAYICDYVRTPIGRYGGSLSSMRADDLLAVTLRELVSRNSQVDWKCVDDVISGCANQSGEDNRNVARMAVLLSGLPQEIPATTINRLCGSGIDAILMASRAIKCGEASMIIAAGVENMTRAPFVFNKSTTAFSRQTEMFDTTMGWRFVNPKMMDNFGVDSMPQTAQNVANRFNISRADQDLFAFNSQSKAQQAIANGRMNKETFKVTIAQPRNTKLEFFQDEHPRLSSIEKLSTLKPLFAEGSITAGNSSGINDGAAAMLIASKQMVEKYGLKVLAKVSGGAVSGVEPAIMGIGPVSATNKICNMLDLDLNQIDVIELNEAFASQAIAVLRKLGLAENDPRVNPNGGAIALGHPLGMSGIRIAGSAVLELNLQNKQTALATMCIGVGQGIAAVFESC